MAYHTARRLLATNCDACHNAIDTDDEYKKYVAVMYGQFYWSVTHVRCHNLI